MFRTSITPRPLRFDVSCKFRTCAIRDACASGKQEMGEHKTNTSHLGWKNLFGPDCSAGSGKIPLPAHFFRLERTPLCFSRISRQPAYSQSYWSTRLPASVTVYRCKHFSAEMLNTGSLSSLDIIDRSEMPGHGVQTLFPIMSIEGGTFPWHCSCPMLLSRSTDPQDICARIVEVIMMSETNRQERS